MKLQHLFSLLLTLLITLTTGCNNDSKEEPGKVSLTVAPTTIELGSAAAATASATITTSAAWTATIQGDGFSVDQLSGTGNASISVTATAANTATEAKALGSVTIAAVGVSETKTISISQAGVSTPKPNPDDLTLTIDFTKGIGITTPALPNQKAEAAKGLIEYQIEGYVFSLYTDSALAGVFYWIDNTVFPGNTAPEPNKGLFIGKLGAYVKFPAIEGKTLTKVSYIPTTSQSGDVKLDLMGGNGEEIQYMMTPGKTEYELITPSPNTAYRLEVINTKNAQIATLTLTYVRSN